jgi:hypothetical protein
MTAVVAAAAGSEPAGPSDAEAAAVFFRVRFAGAAASPVSEADALAAFFRVRFAGAGVSVASPEAAAGGIDAAALGAVDPLGVGGPAGRLADRRRRLAGAALPLVLAALVGSDVVSEVVEVLVGSSSSTRSPHPLPGPPGGRPARERGGRRTPSGDGTRRKPFGV